MSVAPAIRALSLGKRYRLGERAPYRTLREALMRRVPGARGHAPAHAPRWFDALSDVSFEIADGEVVGIIGRNGAGKSTLLKILSRITQPSSGQAEIYGRVGSLLEVGTGFHPELTGRENIFLNGAILGMRRAEIEAKFSEIVEFAEVEAFLDTPVKHYSSGLYMRLAFAVAAHLEPEILVIDEVLAVGDVAFQRKCLGKMGDVARAGRTVLFVSHNMAAVSGLCTRALLLEQGRIVADGKPDLVIRRYLEAGEHVASIPLADRSDRSGDGSVRLTRIRLSDGEGRPVPAARVGDTLRIALDFAVADGARTTAASFEVGVYNVMGELVALCGNGFAGPALDALPPVGTAICSIPDLPFAPGIYNLNVFCGVVGRTADWVKNAAQLQVVEADFFGTGRLPPDNAGQVMLRHAWTVGEGMDR